MLKKISFKRWGQKAISFLSTCSAALVSFFIPYFIFQHWPGGLPFTKLIWRLLNSDFAMAFIGAVAGSATILTIESVRRQEALFADINSALAVLSYLSNTLLNIKYDHTLPLLTDFQMNCREFELRSLDRNRYGVVKVMVLPIKLKNFHRPDISLDISMERIAMAAATKPELVMLLSQTKRMVSEVPKMYDHMNEMIFRFHGIHEEGKAPFYLGLRASSTLVDQSFPDAVFNTFQTVESAIFFVNKSILALQSLGAKTLPPWLRRRVAKSSALPKYAAIMPPDNYLTGWDIHWN